MVKKLVGYIGCGFRVPMEDQKDAESFPSVLGIVVFAGNSQLVENLCRFFQLVASFFFFLLIDLATWRCYQHCRHRHCTTYFPNSTPTQIAAFKKKCGTRIIFKFSANF